MNDYGCMPFVSSDNYQFVDGVQNDIDVIFKPKADELLEQIGKGTITQELSDNSIKLLDEWNAALDNDINTYMSRTRHMYSLYSNKFAKVFSSRFVNEYCKSNKNIVGECFENSEGYYKIKNFSINDDFKCVTFESLTILKCYKERYNLDYPSIKKETKTYNFDSFAHNFMIGRISAELFNEKFDEAKRLYNKFLKENEDE